MSDLKPNCEGRWNRHTTAKGVYLHSGLEEIRNSLNLPHPATHYLFDKTKHEFPQAWVFIHSKIVVKLIRATITNYFSHRCLKMPKQIFTGSAKRE